VRDVAAHTVAYLDQSRLSLFRAYGAARWDVDRLNERGLARSGLHRDEVAAAMRHGVDPRGAGALYGCRVALIECVIHQLDVRRPLGLPRAVPADALRATLTFARTSPVISTPRGVHWVATDVDWAAGRGPEVRGKGEALLLAMTGRGFGNVEGPGVQRLYS
jgi:uncharacterized protein (TIGR03083 family)